MTPSTPLGLRQGLRVVALALLLAPLPLTLRLLGIYALDTLDCAEALGLNPLPCNSPEYQWNDKLVDTLTYVVVLAFLAARHPHGGNYLLLGMLLYRAIGVAKYGADPAHDAAQFVQHPDMFREFSLLLAAVHDGWLPDSAGTVAAGALAVALLKPAYERLHHLGTP